jgi:6-phosphogluconolactonase (cycloisomerase 2 family)
MNIPGASAIALAICLCLSACGGSGNAGGGPTSGYAYIAADPPQNGQTQGAVYQYRVDKDGALSALSPASVTVGPTPQAIVSDPSGRFVYVVSGDATISQYAVGGGGALAALSPNIVNITVPASNAPTYSAAVDPNGRFLYVVISPLAFVPPDSYIAEYAIGTGGQLTALAPAYITAPIPAGSALAFDSSGKHAYLASVAAGPAQLPGSIAQFSVADDGTLATLPTAIAAPPGTGTAIAFHGQTAYLLSRCIDAACDGQVTEYTVQSDGSLAPTGATTMTGSHVIPMNLLTNVSGTAAYLLTNLMGIDTNVGAVYQYTISSTGGLMPGSPASLGVASGSVAEGTLGSNLYVLSSNSIEGPGPRSGGNVDYYVIGADGLLTFMSTTTSVAAGSFIRAMTLVATH